MSSQISCNTCQSSMEYDEGEGNLEDGYDCYDCLNELKGGKDEIKN